MVGNIYINGNIGNWEGEPCTQLTDVVKQIKAYPEATAFNVFINSEGGFVKDGMDIYNYLVSLGKPVNTIGTGIVASIATIIFMAGSTRTIRPNTRFMIHLPSLNTQGTADELEMRAKELRTIEKELINFYTTELGHPAEVIQPLLRDESFLSLDQLETLGFITSAPLPIAAKANLNTNKQDNKMEDNKKAAFVDKMLNKILGMFDSKPVNKLVQDATGVELDFTELADGDPIEVGAMAMVAGVPAEGDYTLPDGTVYTFVAGELTAITPAGVDTVTPEQAKALADENAALKAEIETLRATNSANEQNLAEIKTEVVNLKRAITTGGAPAGKVDGKKEPVTQPASGYKAALDRAKNIRK